MAILQSDWAAGRKVAPVSREAGGVVVERYDFAITENVAAGDIIELAILPSYHRIAAATLIPQGSFAGATADVGIMSGDVGSPDPARTVGDELFSAEALTDIASLSTSPALLLEPTEKSRSIGVKFSAAVTAVPDMVISVLLFTYQ